MHQLLFKHAAREDAKAINRIKREASLSSNEYGVQLLGCPELLEVPLEQIESERVLVAVSDGQIVGFVEVGCGEAELEIKGLFVDPTFWRRGVGRALIERSAEYFGDVEGGCFVVVASPDATDFYRSCGFVSLHRTGTRFGPAVVMRRHHSPQVRAFISHAKQLFNDSLLGIYLHGSAVEGRLRPQSDIDLLVTVNRPIAEHERNLLVAWLLKLSGRHPRQHDQPRCLEVVIFDANGRGIRSYPAQAEVVYGEWLREAYEQGITTNMTADPEHTLILAQARMSSIPLLGYQLADTLPDVPVDTIQMALRDCLPGLMNTLEGDERNVLLTLTRIWRTLELGDFVSKDTAAAWAALRLSADEAFIVDYARRAYLGEIADIWSDKRVALHLTANQLRRHIGCLL